MGPVDVIARHRGTWIAAAAAIAVATYALVTASKTPSNADDAFARELESPDVQQILRHVDDTLPAVDEHLRKAVDAWPSLDASKRARMARGMAIAQEWSGPVALGAQHTGTVDIDGDGRLDCWRSTYVGVADLDWYVDAQLGCTGARVRVSVEDVMGAQLVAAL